MVKPWSLTLSYPSQQAEFNEYIQKEASYRATIFFIVLWIGSILSIIHALVTAEDLTLSTLWFGIIFFSAITLSLIPILLSRKTLWLVELGIPVFFLVIMIQTYLFNYAEIYFELQAV